MQKKTWQHILSLILVLTLLVSSAPVQVYAIAGDALASALQADADDTATLGQELLATQRIVEEDESKRSEFSKEFVLNNGLRLATLYPSAVHYEDNGTWKEIDNTLIAAISDGQSVYTNSAGKWSIHFPQSLNGNNMIGIAIDGFNVQFGMAGELRSTGDVVVASVGQIGSNEIGTLAVSAAQISTAQIQQVDLTKARATAKYPETVLGKMYSRLTYANIYPGTNVIYDLQGNKLKESVVMQQYDSSLWGYRYTLDTGNLIPVLNENQQIDLCDPNTNETVLTMPAPYMVDNNGEHSYDVEVSLTRTGGVYLLSYYLPREWLADAERAWPIILDPIISADCNCENIEDNTVGESSTESYKDSTLECGYSPSVGVRQCYLKYVDLPPLTSADVIVDATISLYKPTTFDYSTVVEVHKVSGAWDSETITWDNKPAPVSTVEDYVVCSAAGRYKWNVTDIVRDWYANTNTGMMLKVSDDAENAATRNWQQFYASDYSNYASVAPLLEITFRNANGIESYWDYTAHSAGRAGTGYVNNYTGNLVWIHNDIGFGGNRMPVSISHVYNANDAANNLFGMGYGWRTNYNQRVYEWSEDSSYYVWEDSDGTLHYFYQAMDENGNVVSGTYLDEDGLYLTLTTTGTGDSKYCLSDDYGNASYFDTHGRLTKIENNQKSKSNISITYTTESGNLISTITDGAGRIYRFTYTNNLLSRISYTGSGTSEISYVTYSYTGSLLTGITQRGADSIAYAYCAQNLFTSAEDADGYKLVYSYNLIDTANSTQPSRVETITEYSGTALGGQITIEYAHNQTRFTDHDGNVQILQFNNWGNTVSIQDGEGRGKFAAYNAPESGTKEKGNQLLLSSKLQNTVGNMLTDNSFELGYAWTKVSTAVTSVFSTAEAYYGTKSLAVSRSTAGSASGVYKTLSVTAGETYTFSAYVKTGSGATAYLEIVDSTGSSVTSELLAAGRDWTRLQVSYTAETNTTVKVRFMTATAGTVYMDCAQMEHSPTASRYNLVNNGDFSSTVGWTLSTTATGNQRVTATKNDENSTLDPAAPQLNAYAYRLTGNPEGQVYLKQTVAVSGEAHDTFVLAGWAKGDSVPLPDEEEEENEEDENIREFCIRGVFTYEDGNTQSFDFNFNPDTDSTVNWQYAAGVMIAEQAYTQVDIYLVYDYNANTVLFDGIQLYKEEFGYSYTYDANGNITAVKDIQGQTTNYSYNSKQQLTQVALPSGSVTSYTYDNYHNVTTATSDTGVVYAYTYDNWGNNTSVSVYSVYNEEEGFEITTSATYSTDGNRLVSTTDTRGNVTLYAYNENTNVLEWVQYPEDTESTRTEYTYDAACRLIGVSVDTDSGSSLYAEYNHEYDRLVDLTTPSTTYSFSYGKFGLRTKVSIGSRTLAQYSYDEQTNFLEKLDYGNGDSVQYEYDSLGRVLTQTYEDGDTVTYDYDNNGALATVTDSATGRTTTYYYDMTNRLVQYVETGSNYAHGVGYAYDTLNRMAAMVEIIDDVSLTTAYTYDEYNRLKAVTTGDLSLQYAYDDYNRPDIHYYISGSSFMEKDYSYYSTDEGVTNLVSRLAYSTSSFDAAYAYTYDNNGNILSVGDGTSTTSYVYDNVGQLIRENNQAANKTWVWTYDDAGNITSKTEYGYTTGTLGTALSTVAYYYPDSSWADLLMGYGSRNLTYDGIGNLLSDGTWTYTWEHGRELAAMTNGVGTWTFSYDANGMRTGRTMGSYVYTYVYNGSQLSKMTYGSNVLYFTYDAAGTPATVTYNDVTYFYVTNLQGDVVAILNSSGAQVVGYTYDAWGKLLTTTGTMAFTLGLHNPLRYRGYVYDRETDLYYLQSRYYDPAIGRFINADALVSTGTGLLGNNMFAYCNNNPVNNYDSGGTSPISYCNGDRNPLFIGYYGCGGGGGGGGSFYCGYGSTREAKAIIQREKDFYTNTDEQIVLESDGLSFYHGIPVLRANFGEGGAFSFIIIVLDDDYQYDETGINTLKHEYGHKLHMDDIGVVNYLLTTAIPSLIGAGLSNAGIIDVDYYSLPWEYVANMYGNVSHNGYTSWADEAGVFFWTFTKNISKLTGGI